MIQFVLCLVPPHRLVQIDHHLVLQKIAMLSRPKPLWEHPYDDYDHCHLVVDRICVQLIRWYTIHSNTAFVCINGNLLSFEDPTSFRIMTTCAVLVVAEFSRKEPKYRIHTW